MGARNGAAALTVWTELPHGPMRLLLGMALHALDAPSPEGRPARVYFGGEKGLVSIHGRSRSQMYVALSQLEGAGAITVLEAGRNRHRAVYRLNLELSDPAAKRPGTQDAERPAQGPGNPDAEASRKPGLEASRKPGLEASRKPGPLGTTEEPRRTSRTGNTSPPEVPHQGTDHPVHDLEDEDPELTAARATLARLGPDRYQATLDAAHADHAHDTTRDLVIAAAKRARNGAPR